MKEELLYHPNTILKKQSSSMGSILIGIHLVFLLFLLIFFSFYPLETRIEFVGYYEEGKILVMVDKSFFEISHPVVKIGEESYSYQVVEVKPAAYEEGEISLWQIQLRMDIKESWKVNNHQFRLSFLKEKKTVMKRILSAIKKGMNL